MRSLLDAKKWFDCFPRCKNDKRDVWKSETWQVKEALRQFRTEWILQIAHVTVAFGHWTIGLFEWPAEAIMHGAH